ncbi:MAG: hypothetical protein ACI8TP_004089 [Acidimicrobiales bacterium]|jgi:hypothetical protein
MVDFLSPQAATRIDERPLAARTPDLSGKRVALLDNQKANASYLLETVGNVLLSRHPEIRLTTELKIATSPSPPDVMERLRSCDAVVLAIAD